MSKRKARVDQALRYLRQAVLYVEQLRGPEVGKNPKYFLWDCGFSSSMMRDCALAVNDGRLNDAKVSVRQIREILRFYGATVEERDPRFTETEAA